MSNKYLSTATKTRLKTAAKLGRDQGSCDQFSCDPEKMWT